MGDWIAAAAWFALFASGTQAVESELDREPDWLNKPTFQSMLSVYPIEAMKEGFGGRALLSCKVNTRGVLFDCTVVNEEPSGAGFGAAALALTPQFLMTPAIKGGVAVEANVRIPINFAMPFPGRPHFQPEDYTRQVVSNPAWLAAPSVADVAAAYPPKARASRAGGQVTLVCILTKVGALSHCRTLREEPDGLGFARAAERLAPRFTAPEQLKNGEPIADAAVHVPIAFSPEMLDGRIPPGRPHWAEKPSAADLAANFPASARKTGLRTARADLVCQVVASGRLGDCRAESEEPPGHGVGAAATSLAPKFRISPWSEDGVPMVGVKVRVPVRFALDEAPAS